VIAEGVETVEQRDFLINVGYDAFQVYYFCRPMQANGAGATAEKKHAKVPPPHSHHC
jgi:EAL domain-containing protein (putative c-di-GMP-specific phosphodiesterase class I)